MKNFLSINNAKNYLVLSVLPLALIFFWEGMASCGLTNKAILPAPSVIFASFLNLIVSGDLMTNIFISLQRVLKGFVVGGTAGVVTGFLIGYSKKFELLTRLLLGVLRPIPIIAWIPLLILWAGIDELSKVLVIAIGSFWPVLLNTIYGVKNVDDKLLEVAAIHGKNKWELIRQVILPASLPAIFTGLKIGLGIAWMCVIGAELIASSSGLGYMLILASETFRSDVMLVCVMSVGLIGYFLELLLIMMERRFIVWIPVKRR